MLRGGDVEARAALIGGDLLPCPGGELATRQQGPANGLGDGAEWHLENVVQHEDDPLGRGQSLQHHQQSKPDAVVEGDPIGGVSQLRTSGQGRDFDVAGIASELPA